MSMTVFNPKIALLGSGMIGGTAGLLCGLKKLSSNIVMLDVVEGMPMGKGLDLRQALACEGIEAKVDGCSDISAESAGLEGAHVVIVTAGFPRKPGMSRDDLLGKNAEVITGVALAIKAKCPQAFVICITNPLDVMVSLLQKVSGLPAGKVVGMGGMLDSNRFKSFLAEKLNVSVQDVSAMVLGGHGDDMVPVRSACSVGGVSIDKVVEMGLMTEADFTAIVERTRNGGGEIVALMKMGSAFVAPAACAVQMAEAYLRDLKRLVPCCCLCTGEYGIADSYMGVPCVIGAQGVERILQIPLTPTEKEMLAKSQASVKELRDTCTKLGYNA